MAVELGGGGVWLEQQAAVSNNIGAEITHTAT